MNAPESDIVGNLGPMLVLHHQCVGQEPEIVIEGLADVVLIEQFLVMGRDCFLGVPQESKHRVC